MIGESVKTRKRRGARMAEPLFEGPIPDNPEYREMVTRILKDKRRRDLIDSYRNTPPRTTAEAVGEMVQVGFELHGGVGDCGAKIIGPRKARK